MKLFTIVGARPQIIKAYPVMEAIKAVGIENELIHTGQHFDNAMSDVFFEELRIPRPKLNLNINGGTHGLQTGRMICELEKVLIQEEPSMIVVFGDTNSTLAAAIVAAKLHIPIAHIEAGLRSFNLKMPEEINRILTDRVSTLLFTPTKLATQNLKNEGVSGAAVHEVGDVMYDAVLSVANRLSPPSTAEPYVYCTCHRQENTANENNLFKLFSCLESLSRSVKVVFPVHPRIKDFTDKHRSLLGGAVELIEPQSYLNNISYMKYSNMVLTDSGGMQKEAFFLKKKCVTLRAETEWQELVDLGVNYLEPLEHLEVDALVGHFNCSPVNDDAFNSLPYGDGNASTLIARQINNYLISM